jgi:hypothetical protein
MAGSTDQEDREEMARLNAGQDAALNVLMDRHGERLFHYLVRQLNGRRRPRPGNLCADLP